MIVNIMWASQTRFPSQSHFRVSIPKSAGDVEVSSLAQYHGELQTCYYWKLCTIKDNKWRWWKLSRLFQLKKYLVYLICLIIVLYKLSCSTSICQVRVTSSLWIFRENSLHLYWLQCIVSQTAAVGYWILQYSTHTLHTCTVYSAVLSTRRRIR